MNKVMDMLLERATARFGEAEVLLESSKNYALSVYEGDFETIEISEVGGISLRVLHHQKMGMSYSEKVSEDVVELLIEQAAMSLEHSPRGAELPFLAGEEKSFGEAFSFDLERYREDLLKTEAFIYEKSPDIKSCEVKLQSVMVTKQLKNSKGIDFKETSGGGIVYAQVVINHDEGMEMGFDFQSLEDFSPEVLSEGAYRDALDGIGASSIPSKKMDLIIRGDTFGMLLSAFSSIFSAEQNQKDMSVLKGRLGETISSPVLTLLDDARYEGSLIKRYFDSEGVETRNYPLIEEGVFKGFLQSRKTAEKEGSVPTGHGYRPPNGAVHVSATTLVVKPGESSVSELLEALGDGLYIRDFQAYHSGVNPVSGDFSLPAKAFLVEDGRLSRPVNQVMVSGNILDVFRNLSMVANKTKNAMMRAFSPDVLIKDLTVSGE